MFFAFSYGQRMQQVDMNRAFKGRGGRLFSDLVFRINQTISAIVAIFPCLKKRVLV